MVAKRKPTRDETINRLARAGSHGEQSRVPFLRPPEGVDLAGLMEFDRVACLTHRQFLRPLHPADLSDLRLAREIGPGATAGTVLVTRIGPGLRARLITERRAG